MGDFCFGFCMLNLVSLIVSPFLLGILETVWDKHSVTAATPPPSPTSGESGMLCMVRVSPGNSNS